MHSNFADAGKAARAAIEVPPLPWEGIRRRSRAGTNGKLRTLVLCGVAGVAAIAGAAAAELHAGIQLWLRGDGARIAVTSFAIENMPTPAQVRATAAKATFAVIFPVGLPASSRLVRIIYAPADRPNAIDVEYWNARSHRSTNFFIVDSSVVNTGVLPMPGSARVVSKMIHWQAGGETVLSGANAGNIRNAMEAATPAQSLAANEAMASSIWVLGGSFESAEAARVLASDGVLLDRGNIARIAALAKAQKPLVATRTTYLTNIPHAHGEPLYNKASLQWDREVAVSANGVRAIARVMDRERKLGPSGCCEILYVPGTDASTIWTIPVSPGMPPQKYVIPTSGTLR